MKVTRISLRCTGNRLPISCNRLHHLEINWNVANSVENFLKSNFVIGNRLQETGNRLPKSKNSGNLENFEKNSFEKTKLCYVCFLKNLFNTSLVRSS